MREVPLHFPLVKISIEWHECCSQDMVICVPQWYRRDCLARPPHLSSPLMYLAASFTRLLLSRGGGAEPFGVGPSPEGAWCGAEWSGDAWPSSRHRWAAAHLHYSIGWDGLSGSMSGVHHDELGLTSGGKVSDYLPPLPLALLAALPHPSCISPLFTRLGGCPTAAMSLNVAPVCLCQ